MGVIYTTLNLEVTFSQALPRNLFGPNLEELKLFCRLLIKEFSFRNLNLANFLVSLTSKVSLFIPIKRLPGLWGTPELGLFI